MRDCVMKRDRRGIVEAEVWERQLLSARKGPGLPNTRTTRRRSQSCVNAKGVSYHLQLGSGSTIATGAPKGGGSKLKYLRSHVREQVMCVLRAHGVENAG